VIDLTCGSDHATPLMLGMVKHAARDIEQRLRADRPAPERAESPSGLSSLTAEERAVAELVAEGLTNAVVAQTLALSPYAIHSTLRRVFTKLGVRSRVQLARTLADQRHDSVSQALFSISLHSRAVELAVHREGVDPQGRVALGLAELRSITQEALAESVRLSSGDEPGPRDA
jgi:DNA-binding CsgD family transcriptional regulator